MLAWWGAEPLECQSLQTTKATSWNSEPAHRITKSKRFRDNKHVAWHSALRRYWIIRLTWWGWGSVPGEPQVAEGRPGCWEGPGMSNRREEGSGHVSEFSHATCPLAWLALALFWIWPYQPHLVWKLVRNEGLRWGGDRSALHFRKMTLCPQSWLNLFDKS